MSRISYSQISMYGDCPLKWKLNYVDKLRIFQSSIHLIFGTAMHEVLQNYFTIMYEHSVKAADAFDSAACIGCGACVAVCKNSSASLFVSAKVSQLSILPQGEPEKKERVINMVNKMDDEGFGHCSNTGACEAQCPKDISIKNITRMNNEYLKAKLKS